MLGAEAGGRGAALPGQVSQAGHGLRSLVITCPLKEVSGPAQAPRRDNPRQRV